MNNSQLCERLEQELEAAHTSIVALTTALEVAWETLHRFAVKEFVSRNEMAAVAAEAADEARKVLKEEAGRWDT